MIASIFSRILFNIIIFFALTWSPWWVFVLVMVVFASIFKKPYESLVWAVGYDSLYIAPSQSFLHTYPATLITIAAIIVIMYVRPRLILSLGH